VLRGAWKWNLQIKEGETDCFEWVQPKLGRIVPPKVGINALYHQPVRTAASTVIPKFDRVVKILERLEMAWLRI
jgi:hypothetical protein